MVKIFSLRPQLQDIQNLHISEVTFRESSQAVNPLMRDQALVFTPQSRLELTTLMMDFGVEQIEIGAPHDSYVLKNAREIVYMAKHSRKTRVAIHCRCHADDVAAFFATGADIVNFYIGTSVENRNGNGGKTIKEIKQKAKQAILAVRETDSKKYIRFSTEDAFRTKWEDLTTVVGTVYQMVNAIGLPDTVGVAYPDEVFSLINKLRMLVSDSVDFEFHGHNDRGNATINALAALRAGAHIIDTAILGYGERNGITSLNGLISELANPELLPILEKKYDLKKLIPLIKTFSQIIDIPISHDQPIVAPGAVRHVAGVHVKAVGFDNRAYLSFDPSFFSLENDQYSLVASSTVGGVSIQKWTQQNLGINLTTQQAREVASKVRTYAFIHGPISENEVQSIVLSYSQELSSYLNSV